MAFNHDAGRNGAGTQTQQPDAQGSQLWKDLSLPKAPPKRSRRGRVLVLVSVVLLIALIFAGLRFSALATGSDDQMQISIGSQQTATLDLRQSFPISPDLYGVNTFPPLHSDSVDAVGSGFMVYGTTVINGLQSMGVKSIRFPGGLWGEQHTLSYDQLGKFAQVLNETNADGLIQAHLGDLTVTSDNVTTTDKITAGAQLAGAWVNFMNDPKSYVRTQTAANSNLPYHKVVLWTVGNEPDQASLTTKLHITVAQYVNAFIQFSEQMHKNDNNIKVFGPDLSHFSGIGAGPFDTQGQAWMESFLKGVSDYEKSHKLPYNLLDGVSFHYYPFNDAQRDPSMLLSNSDTWNYIIPPLHTLIMRDFGRDMSIAVTEINSNPSSGTQPTRGNAALWWADTLGALMNQQVQFAGYFSVAGIGSPYQLYDGNGKETPMVRVMQLFSHLQHNVVPLSIQHDPVSVYATMDDAHQVVSLLFVNKSSSNQLAQIRPTDKFLSVSAWPSIDVSLQGYGMVVMTLHRGLSGGAGTAEAYSYTAPPNDGSAVLPVKYTQCGNRTDPLTSDVPC